jgi:uncharacterized protein Smg (DUF494 family)
MYERVVEIILMLMNELKSNKQLADVDVSMLSKSGYTASEISTAFSWLFDQISTGREIVAAGKATSSSHRILHDAERMVISPEAYGYLLQWIDMGVLGQSDAELIIEKVMAAGFAHVGIEEMKSFIAGMLFQIDDSGREGSRFSLGANDTIH